MSLEQLNLHKSQQSCFHCGLSSSRIAYKSVLVNRYWRIEYQTESASQFTAGFMFVEHRTQRESPVLQKSLCMRWKNWAVWFQSSFSAGFKLLNPLSASLGHDDKHLSNEGLKQLSRSAAHASGGQRTTRAAATSCSRLVSMCSRSHHKRSRNFVWKTDCSEPAESNTTSLGVLICQSNASFPSWTTLIYLASQNKWYPKNIKKQASGCKFFQAWKEDVRSSSVQKTPSLSHRVFQIPSRIVKRCQTAFWSNHEFVGFVVTSVTFKKHQIVQFRFGIRSNGLWGLKILLHVKSASVTKPQSLWFWIPWLHVPKYPASNSETLRNGRWKSLVSKMQCTSIPLLFYLIFPFFSPSTSSTSPFHPWVPWTLSKQRQPQRTQSTGALRAAQLLSFTGRQRYTSPQATSNRV